MKTEMELIEEFEMVLDETTPLVEIGSLTYSPSDVLRKMDPIAYRQEFLNWLDFEGYQEDENGDFEKINNRE